MGFRNLKVINEDRVMPGAGFGTYSHRDMEIVTYVRVGALAQKHSTGTSSVIKAADVQRVSAGTGITHSEYNASKTSRLHFLDEPVALPANLDYSSKNRNKTPL